MAGDWIKVQTCTPDKPEVHLIAERLQIDPDAVTGKLIRVWCWADQQTIDGNARSVTKTLLDRITCVTGFADCLLSVGWLIETEAGFVFPHFNRHNGNTAKTRATSAKRVEKHRKTDVTEMKRKCNAETVTKALPEKRREEKSIVSKETIESTDTSALPIAPAETELLPVISETPAQTSAVSFVAAQYAAAIGGKVIVTDKRRKSILARLRDPWWREHWQDALEAAPHSEFLRGEGKSGWRMTFDWFIQPDSVVKILEGNYDGTRNKRETFAEKREHLNATGFEWIRQAAAEAACSAGGSEGSIIVTST